MKIPYVKVNNQKEFERVVAKMEIKTGLKFDGYLADIYTVVGLNDIHSKITTWNEKFISDKIISADEYLTGIRENFTLGDLEDGMVVEVTENKNIKRYIVIKNSAITIHSYLTSDLNKDYKKDFSSNNNHDLHINKIYKFNESYSFSDIFNKDNLTLIFDAESHRNKYKISQRKSEIENEIKKLQEELKSLEVK